MTEQEYINVSDLKNITSVIKILLQVIPENSKVISKDDYQKIMQLLFKWQEKLFKVIEVKE